MFICARLMHSGRVGSGVYKRHLAMAEKARLNRDKVSLSSEEIGMPKRHSRGSGFNDFDVSVDEGTFGDYEVFGVYNDDAPEGSEPEYEIFIVATAQEV